MSTQEIIFAFGFQILFFMAVLIGSIWFLVKLRKNGLKGFMFMGYDVEEIGTIQGRGEYEKDSITVYRLTKGNRYEQWCLNIITKSRKYHGGGRVGGGEYPYLFSTKEMKAIISTFTRHKDEIWN